MSDIRKDFEVWRRMQRNYGEQYINDFAVEVMQEQMAEMKLSHDVATMGFLNDIKYRNKIIEEMADAIGSTIRSESFAHLDKRISTKLVKALAKYETMKGSL